MRSRKGMDPPWTLPASKRSVSRVERQSAKKPYLSLRLVALASVLILYLACVMWLVASLDLAFTGQAVPSVLYQYVEKLESGFDGARMISGQATVNLTDEKSMEDALRVQNYLLRTINRKSLPLTAYVEPPLPVWTNVSNDPMLPLRTHRPEALRRYTYQRVNSCKDLATNLPVDHPIEQTSKFGSNVGRSMKSLYKLRYEYAESDCPVDADPFLPWIHDVFPNDNGTHVEFVAHNKRRCRTSAYDFMEDLINLEPQVALMQSVPVKRMTEAEVRQVAPSELWSKDSNKSTSFRYRLSSIKDADPDGSETRFICHFHTLRPKVDSDGVEKVVLGETLSVFPYNFEHANYRKPKSHPMLTRPLNQADKHGAHNEHIWNSILHFRCPIPDELQLSISSGKSVVEDVPTVYLDLVTIRTRPRVTREGYFPQGLKMSSFDVDKEWGAANVIPTVEASGRWSNIPICRPPVPSQEVAAELNNQNLASVEKKGKLMLDTKRKVKHTLVGCLWASASFATRGYADPTDSSSVDRLLEWLTFHLYIAKMDHIYVYDNSAAYSNTTSLAPVVDLFPSDRVTRIPWSHRVCNNNGPSHPNVGERSSQYAAEASCRLRYGPSTEWMISFDTDEYLIPQGKWSDLKQWLTESDNIDKNTHILSFFQTRAAPILDFMEPYYDKKDASKCGRTSQDSKCLAKRSDVTFLQTYDCESIPLPKPEWAWRAKKQIYKPWYVLNHYVHYSTVTKRLLDHPNEISPAFKVKAPFERRVDELNEAFMLHTKTTTPTATRDWETKCHIKNASDKNTCPVGIPYPSFDEDQQATHRHDGMKYNCYSHQRVKELSTQLKRLMQLVLDGGSERDPEARI